MKKYIVSGLLALSVSSLQAVELNMIVPEGGVYEEGTYETITQSFEHGGYKVDLEGRESVEFFQGPFNKMGEMATLAYVDFENCNTSYDVSVEVLDPRPNAFRDAHPEHERVDLGIKVGFDVVALGLAADFWQTATVRIPANGNDIYLVDIYNPDTDQTSGDEIVIGDISVSCVVEDVTPVVDPEVPTVVDRPEVIQPLVGYVESGRGSFTFAFILFLLGVAIWRYGGWWMPEGSSKKSMLIGGATGALIGLSIAVAFSGQANANEIEISINPIGTSFLNPKEYNLHIDTPTDTLDGSTQAWGLGVGYVFDEIWSVHLDYTDLGSYNISDMDIPYEAFTLTTEYNKRQGNHELAGVIGIGFLNADTDENKSQRVIQTHDQSLVLGVSYDYHVQEWLSYNISATMIDTDASVLLAGVSFKFGQGEGVTPVIIPEEPVWTLEPAVYEVLGVSSFAYDSFHLYDFDKAALMELFTGIQSDYGDSVVEIVLTGHSSNECGKCDLDPQYNQKLSEKRSEAVYDWIAVNFPMYEDKTTYVGVGADEPITESQETEEERSQNRVVEVQVYVEGMYD